MMLALTVDEEEMRKDVLCIETNDCPDYRILGHPDCGEYGGEIKKALTENNDKCLNLLERDTRFERATFSLGS